MAGLTGHRVAEIIVEAATGDRRRGSGYLVASGRVLTAAHVVASATAVRVRFEADRPGERVLEAEVSFEHPPTDVAVLTVPSSPEDLPVARFGRVGERDAVLRCSAMGFPAFKMRRDEDGRPYRDAEHVHGTCAVLSNRREGTLDLSVPPPDGSWDGMSGAVVFSGDRIVGVVAAHHHADGAGRLAVSRADRWAEKLASDELSQLEACLTVGLAHLPDVLLPSALSQIEAGYQALLRDIAPPELKGRAEELRELLDFCAGPETYRWIQGRPWTGKTALVSWFALHPPRGVVPVSFFITSRLAGQADSTAYTEAVVHQLAAIVGREPSPHASPGVREAERRQLLAEAAERVAEDGGTLLLVVDGLDEDQSVRPGGTGPSIASLLPDRLPPNVRVLVASRPNPDLPLDVKARHPLRGDVVRHLSATEYAQDLEHDARFELSRALAGDDLEKDIIGLLAAARGSLRSEELRELTGQQLYAVRHRVGGVFGRILRRRGRSARPHEKRGYLFAHETLFAAATEMLGPDLGSYVGRIHAWAAEYRERGWPPETPPYLLHGYPRMVAALGDFGRATSLATDPRRQDRIREETGSDSAALAEIDAVAAVVERDAPNDLGRLGALAAARALLARRNSALPPNLPPVLARLGQVRRAEALARSVYGPVDRAQALAGVAEVLAERGNERAATLAREAERLAHDRSSGSRDVFDAERTREITTSVAVVLARLGRKAEALDIVEQLRPWNDHTVVALGRVSLALRPHDPRLAAEVADRARQALVELHADDWHGDRGERVRALGAVASALAPVDPAQAARFFDRVERMAEDERTARLPVITAYAAAELRGARPRSALRIGRLAAARAVSRLAQVGDDRSPESELDTGIVTALADLGLISEARELAGAWQRVGTPSVYCLTPLAWDHAAMGDWDEAERVAARIDDPENAAETWAALAERALPDPDRATGLAEHALRVALSPVLEDRWICRRLVVLAEALAACGAFGEAERLARLLGRPEERVMALARTALRRYETDPDGARLTAEEAADEVAAFDKDSPGHLSYLEAVAMMSHALARIGLGSWRPVGHLDRLIKEHFLLETLTALGEHFPRDATRLAVVEKRCLTAPKDERLGPGRRQRHASAAELEGRRLTRCAEVVAALGYVDPERARRALEAVTREMVGDWAVAGPVATVTAGLLVAGTDPEWSRELLALSESQEDVGGWRGREALGPRALVHAARGDYRRADELLLAMEERWGVSEPEFFPPGPQYELREALAATLAGVPWWPWSTLAGACASRPYLLTRLSGIRGLIEITMPRPVPDVERLAEARRHLRHLLTGPGWYLALPVLAHLDPDAVRRVRDVVFAHLGVEVSPEPPQPSPAPA